ncbi:hypothetical protein IFM89_022459 [Coptis chinensis]|uniref:Uncharacterized protein n=1 Tax=Coptis chinensis TaxID=261450 RepID=A0A835IEK4_9MAGN|nr:hypothetical protein IFM89_022459 [Coptis chinensis]
MEENLYTPLTPPQTIPSLDQIPIEFLEPITNNQMEGLVNNQFQNLRLLELSTKAVWDIIHSPMVSQLLHSKGLMIKSVGTEQEWIPSNQHLYGELQYDMRNNEFELYQNNQWAETVAVQMSIESQISQAETTKIPNAEPNPLNLLHISEDPSLLPMWEIGSASSSHHQVQIPIPFYHCLNKMFSNIMIYRQACYLLIHMFNIKAFPPNCVYEIGDLNVTISNEESLGGKPYKYQDGEPAHTIINDLTLIDIGFQGHPYTSSNKRTSPDNIQKRFDRALVNTDWSNTNNLLLSSTVKWFPPPKEHLQLNVNARFLKNKKQAGYGYVLRDDKGKLVAAGTSTSGALPVQKNLIVEDFS